MSIRKLRAGRVPGVTANTWVGNPGTIFYDEITGQLKISDGETPGGHYIDLVLASTTQAGAVKLGPGVILNGEGQIIIDSTGLDFSFGDFQAVTEIDGTLGATLKTIDANQDINFQSNGSGTINVIGEFSVYKPDGTVASAMAIEPILRVKNDGQIKMLVPGADTTEGAVGIVGGLDGAFQSPANTGVMLHITGIAGTPGIPSRVYNDAQNAFAAYVARRYNGTAAIPTAVLADEEIMRLSGTAHNGTNIPGTANNRIVYKALGNQTLTNAGGSIELWTTPLNSTTLTKVVTIDNANGITSTKFTGPLTGNVTGNADTVTNGVYTNGSYANPSWITSLAASKVGLGSVENTALSTSTHYIGTTSIQYNRASASQTLTGVSIDGNAGTVTNGVVTTGSYSDPSWLTISKSKVGLSAVENTALSTSTHYIGTTSIQYNRASGAQSLTGVSIDGSAGSVAAANITGTTLASNVVTSSLTTVGTLGSLTVTNQVSAKNYNGQARDAGTLGAAGTLTIDFATDHNVLVTLTTTATIAFSNITAGKTVTVMIKNATGNNRAVTLGVVAGNTSGGNAAPNVNDGRTGVLVYRTFGTASTDVYCEVN